MLKTGDWIILWTGLHHFLLFSPISLHRNTFIFPSEWVHRLLDGPQWPSVKARAPPACFHQLNQFLLYFPFSPAAPEQTLHIYWDVLFSENLNFPAFQWVKSEPFTHTWKGSFHHLCQGILLVGTAPTFLFRSPLGGAPMRVLCHCDDSTPYIEMWLKKIPNKYLFEHI